MQLKSVEISNIRGVEHLVFEAGALTIIRGKNGVGKSSVLDAISAVFAGGHDQSLVRQGAKKGEVLLTLDDGTTIEKSITPKSATTTVKNAAGEVIPAPATFIATLAKGFAFDPLAFVHAPHKERADYLSKVMPVTITAAQVMLALDQKRLSKEVSRLIPNQSFDIQQLNLLRKRIYEDRAGTNKAIKIQEGGIDALRQTLPPNWKADGDADAVMAEAQAVVEAVIVEMQAILDEVNAKTAAIDKSFDADIKAVDKWESDQIDSIRQEATAKRKVFGSNREPAKEAIRSARQDDIEAVQEKLAAATSAKAVAAEQAKHFAQQAQSAATIAKYQADLKAAQAEADVYSAAIDAIDAAKDKALKSLPIPGLSTIDGEVMYQQEGLDAPIPFDAVNTQRQYELALKIAAQGAGELGLMVLDNTEALDTENWAHFKAACAASGFQVIAARVDDVAELDVEPVNA